MAMTITQLSFPLKVSKISDLGTAKSQMVLVQNVPWKILVNKESVGGEQWLAVSLNCIVKGQTPKWICPAYFELKLKSYIKNVPPFEFRCDPYVFNPKGTCFGDKVVKWCDLINPAKGYVKDDAIALEIRIEAVRQKCTLMLNELFKSICIAKYQMFVTRVDVLMAAQSSHFKMIDTDWSFTVYKNAAGYLAVHLESMLKMADVKICMMRASFKLLSFKTGGKPIEIVQTSPINNGGMLESKAIISWNALFNPQSVYVKNNQIKIAVNIEINPQEDNNNNTPNDSRLECPICFRDLKHREVVSTFCGHLFCKVCIEKSIQVHKVCPSCNKAVDERKIHPVYLPL